jgi:ABC-type multidrug transport system permease subunit
VRHVWYIAAKELLENRRDRLAALFTIVLPVIFTIFLGLIIGSDENSSLPLALADEDGSPAAEQLIETLEASPLLNLNIESAAEVDSGVKDQDAAAGLVIPAGFGAAVEAGEPVALTFIRVETSSGAQSAWQAVEAAVSELNAGLLAARTAAKQVADTTGTSLDAALLSSAASAVDTQLASPAITVAVVDTTGSAVGHAGGFDQSSTGSLVNWVLFGLLGVAATTVWERRRGLLRRLSVAGVRAHEIIGGKMLAMLIITFLQQLLLVLLGQLAFGVDYFSSPPALLITMVSLSMLAASFGLLISVLFRSEQPVIATTVISAQLLAALGGAWFPLEITSASFSEVAHVLPTAWVMDALHGITLKGWGIAEVLFPMGIVWAWIVGVFAIAVWRYRPD